ncbi:MAG: M23 family metallopeptidase [Actinomycetia bacterium]|nr:M23 family metallopeptidase [Actinomycetes bacterium]
MSAQRALPQESAEAASFQVTPGAIRPSRALVDDVPAEPVALRAPHRAIAAPVTFTVVRTRYASPTTKKRQRRRLARVLAPVGIAAVIAAAGLGGADMSFAAQGGDFAATSVVVAPADEVANDSDGVAADISGGGVSLPTVATVDAVTAVAPVGAEGAAARQTDINVKAAEAQAAAEEAARQQAAQDAAAEQAAQEAAAQQAAAKAAQAKAQAKSTAAPKTATTVTKSGGGTYGYSDGTSATQAYKPNVTPGQFIFPINGQFSSPFGWRANPFSRASELHSGQDIAAKCGTPIKASGDGVVIQAGYVNSLGNYTMIDHGNGITTGYGHQSKIIVTKGQPVKQGDIIGYVGSTGSSTGCHVHFLAAHDGFVFNPTALVQR